MPTARRYANPCCNTRMFAAITRLDFAIKSNRSGSSIQILIKPTKLLSK